jgi:hypothetical protein
MNGQQEQAGIRSLVPILPSRFRVRAKQFGLTKGCRVGYAQEQAHTDFFMNNDSCAFLMRLTDHPDVFSAPGGS